MGFFDEDYAKLFKTRRATIQFRDKIMGGTPCDPEIIRNWLLTRPGLVKDEVHHRQLLMQTLVERGVENISDEMSYDEMLSAARSVADLTHLNGFKRGPDGLYIEGRQVKAMFKESTNILFAGESWGKTRKGPKNFLAERIFVEPDRIYLGVREPSGVELFIGHVSGPRGAQSTLTHHEYVERPQIIVDCVCTRDAITADQWREIWLHAQHNGMGALRSQGFGRFEVVDWQEIESVPPSTVAQRLLAGV
jgi:hypothetical protein